MIVGIIIGIVVVLILIYFLGTRNSLIKLNIRVDEAFSTMDVYLKKRWDLIPNIVATVKGYAKHEKETLTEIVALRNSTYDNMSMSEKIATNQKVNEDIIKIMAIAENYPELKASESFLKLSDEIRDIEDEIAQARKYFNAVVRDYNNKVLMIPSNIVAKMIGYKPKKMFEIASEERNDTKINL